MGKIMNIVASCIVLIMLALALAEGGDTKAYLSSEETILPESILNFQKVISNIELEADKGSALFNQRENNFVFNEEAYKNLNNIIILHSDAGENIFPNFDIPIIGDDIDIKMPDTWEISDSEATNQEQSVNILFEELIDLSDFQEINQKTEQPDLSGEF
jgi:hypothetical protein